MNTNNNNNLQAAVYGNQINSAVVATRQTEQPNNSSGSNNNVNNSNNSTNPVNPANPRSSEQNNPANQPHLRGSEQNSNTPKAIEQSQPHNNIRHSIDQNNNHSNSNNGNNNNAPGQKAIGSLFDQNSNSNKQAQAQTEAQDNLKPIESANSTHKNTNSTVLADPNNQKSTSLPLEKLLDKNSLEAADNNANGNDFIISEHTPKDSEESLNAGKKARRPKTVTSSNPSKSETEQSTISFSISTKEKKQIEAVATLLDYESSDDFLKELISQGLKKYLDATTQALKTA